MEHRKGVGRGGGGRPTLRAHTHACNKCKLKEQGSAPPRGCQGGRSHVWAGARLSRRLVLPCILLALASLGCPHPERSTMRDGKSLSTRTLSSHLGTSTQVFPLTTPSWMSESKRSPTTHVRAGANMCVRKIVWASHGDGLPTMVACTPLQASTPAMQAAKRHDKTRKEEK